VKGWMPAFAGMTIKAHKDAHPEMKMIYLISGNLSGKALRRCDEFARRRRRKAADRL